jgi:hypothetical protein
VTKEMLEELCALLSKPASGLELSKPAATQSSSVAKFPPLLESPDEIQRVKTALARISPDVPRGAGSIDDIDTDPKDYWLAVIWALNSLNWKCGKQLAIEWSMQSDRYNPDEFDSNWNSYNPEKDNRIGIGSLFRLAKTFEVKSWGPLVFEADRIAATQKSVDDRDGGRQHDVIRSSAPPYTFLTTDELKELPSTKWRVKSLLPEHGLASIYGPSGSGKSFLALDLMASIVAGSTFYGHKTTACPVVYVALEGTGGIAKRVEAYEMHHKITLPPTFRIVTDMLSLFSSEASVFAEAVIKAGLNDGVIVIDTLAQSAPGSDENSSAHMGTIIANAQLLQKMTNSLVVLIHHTGKDASRGARGHSSFHAALDAALEVKRTQGGLEWLGAKVKDGASGNATSFRLERVVLGKDEDGDEISSCVAVGDLFRKPPLAQPNGKNQKAVLDALLLKFGAGTTIEADEALNIAKASLTNQTTNTAQRAKEALQGLLGIGRLVLTDDKYALV